MTTAGYTAVAPVSGLASGDKFAFYTVPSGDVNLLTSAFGTKAPCRRIQMIDAGVIVIVRPDGNEMTSPSIPSGTVLDVQAQAIRGSGAGTTASLKILVIW